MTERRIDCVVDRIEDGIAVLIPDDGSEIFEVSEGKFKLSENMCCTAVFREDKLVEILPRSMTTGNKDRLHMLFNKKNK